MNGFVVRFREENKKNDGRNAECSLFRGGMKQQWEMGGNLRWKILWRKIFNWKYTEIHLDLLNVWIFIRSWMIAFAWEFIGVVVLQLRWLELLSASIVVNIIISIVIIIIFPMKLLLSLLDDPCQPTLFLLIGEHYIDVRTVIPWIFTNSIDIRDELIIMDSCIADSSVLIIIVMNLKTKIKMKKSKGKAQMKPTSLSDELRECNVQTTSGVSTWTSNSSRINPLRLSQWSLRAFAEVLEMSDESRTKIRVISDNVWCDSFSRKISAWPVTVEKPWECDA